MSWKIILKKFLNFKTVLKRLKNCYKQGGFANKCPIVSPCASIHTLHKTSNCVKIKIKQLGEIIYSFLRSRIMLFSRLRFKDY